MPFSDPEQEIWTPCPGLTEMHYKSRKWWAFTLVCAVFPFSCAMGTLLYTMPRETSTCPCLSEFPSTMPEATRAGHTVNIGGTSYQYPSTYGLRSCQAHDAGLAPYCAGATRPSWCDEPWCFVDAAACDQPIETTTSFAPTSLVYSYSACGSNATGRAEPSPAVVVVPVDSRL